MDQTERVFFPGLRCAPFSFSTWMLMLTMRHQITFELSNVEEHYHIPLLISPYSYTTYRGS